MENFRNYKREDFFCSPFLNILIGGNAEGKSNFLEAIFYLSNGHSYRLNGGDRVLIYNKSNLNYFKLYGEIESDKGDLTLDFRFDVKRKKKVYINKQEIEKLSDIWGLLNVVIFIPEHLDIIKGPPESRRKFLDDEISQLSKAYRRDLYNYKRTLGQRNYLLKEAKNISDQLNVWDKQLSLSGARIIVSRKRFLEKLTFEAEKINRCITGKEDNFEIKYRSSIENDINEWELPEVANAFLFNLKKRRKAEIEAGVTLVGPHRDEIKFKLNDEDLKIYGSQGQQKTAVLAAKLGELEIYKSETGEYPLLLLDDIFSELDEERQIAVLKMIDNRIQTFITSTALPVSNINSVGRKIINVKEGTLTCKD